MQYRCVMRFCTRKNYVKIKFWIWFETVNVLAKRYNIPRVYCTHTLEEGKLVKISSNVPHKTQFYS